MEVTLGPLDAIPRGEGRTFAVGSRRIAVFHTRQGGVYATQAECPHRAGPLADGLLGGTTLVCPLHSWKFDLQTGQAADGQCALATYPVRVGRNGQVMVELSGKQAAE
jgi:nitrite reductase (NADH) small subunit